jgi:glycosyltransferase involved in cell wall biosynthesis
MDFDLLIDISAGINQRAGIGRYAREITRRLIPMLDPDTTQLWYAEENAPYDPALLEREPWNTLRVRKSPISRSNVDRLFVRQSLPMRRMLRLGNPTDIYSPDFTTPATGNARTHVTVHDLSWLHPEAGTPQPLARFLAPVVERSVDSAATVFTVSEAVRREVIDHYSVPADRVIVASNAAADHFHAAVPLDDDALVTFGLRRPFILSVGTIEPRKNLQVLFEALRLLPPSLQLGVVGRSGWDGPSILRTVEELGLAGRVVRLGFVPDESLPRLMASAAAVVYPSRYEGFGLPVIEALATGTPVVASDLPVFREVGGASVLYFDPVDSVDLAETIELAVTSAEDDSIRWTRQGRARQFDWKTSASIVAQRLLELT